MTVTVGEALGRYQVERILGEGGMASVYQVRHQMLGSLHAVKVLHPHLARRDDIRRRFLDEGIIQARLRHPNILTVTDTINEPGVAGLVMELLEGEDLETYLAREGTAPVALAVDWMLQALDALEYVHANQIIHRDLKPSNLFLCRVRSGATVVRLMDFGIAKVREREQQLTNPDMGMMGTLRYMSPEQLSSPDKVAPQADLFALGAILYESLVGRSPFDDESEYHVMRRISEGRYTLPDGMIPPPLVEVIVRALEPSLEKRIPSAAAFSQALHDAARVERYRRAVRLLHVVEAAGLPHRWWIPEDPDERWLRQQELRLQAWVRENPSAAAVVTAAAAPRSSAGPVAAAEGPRREVYTLAEGITVTLLPIPGGSFPMGSAPDSPGSHDDEQPVRVVRISSLHAMTTPVTQAHYRAVVGSDPSAFSERPANPVEQVDWVDAIQFCNRLSVQAGLTAAYRFEAGVVRWDRTADGFRLPTEAEWEFLRRAGESDPDAQRAERGWFALNAEGTTHPVATRPPNAWGLYDLCGNVYEWCWDRLGAYESADLADPVGAPGGEFRVLRGGSFRSDLPDLRAAFRNGRAPGFKHPSVGFRCVRGAPVA